MAGDSFDLDILGAIEGTDKSSTIGLKWDYLRHYQAAFPGLRNEPITIIEIGVEGGSSLKLWRWFFPRATIVGVDLNPACARYAGDRVIIEIGSQDDPGFLAHLCAKYSPTIVIDDGSHLANHVIYTFERLYPSLRPGGIYVVEDLALHFGQEKLRWRGQGEFSPPAYFLDLARSRMASGWEVQEGDSWGTRRFLLETIDAVTIVGSAVLIRRKAPPPDLRHAIQVAQAWLAEQPNAERHQRFAQYLLARVGPCHEADQALVQALKYAPEHPLTRATFADLRSAEGKLEEASALCLRAIQSDPNDAHLWAKLGHIRGRLNDHAGAVEAFEKATQIAPDHIWMLNSLGLALERKGDPLPALRVAQQCVSLAEKTGSNLGGSLSGLKERAAALKARVQNG